MAEKKQAEVKEVAPPDPVQKALAALASPEATAVLMFRFRAALISFSQAIATLKELKPLVQAKSTSELKVIVCRGCGLIVCFAVDYQWLRIQEPRVQLAHSAHRRCARSFCCSLSSVKVLVSRKRWPASL